MSAVDGFLLVAGPVLIGLMTAGLATFVQADRRRHARDLHPPLGVHGDLLVAPRPSPVEQARRLVRDYVWAATLITGALAAAGLVVLITT